MASFEQAYSKTLKLEGGYQANPKDKGNYNSKGELVGTKYGISAPTLERYLQRPPSVDDVKAITKSTAKNIYKTLYWKPIKGDKIKDQNNANMIFDWFVHSGYNAIPPVKKAINDNLRREELPVTKAWTNKALNALNSVRNQRKLYEDIKERRGNYYKSIAASNKNQAAFLSGYLKRLSSFVYQKASQHTWKIVGGAALVGIGIYLYLNKK